MNKVPLVFSRTLLLKIPCYPTWALPGSFPILCLCCLCRWWPLKPFSSLFPLYIASCSFAPSLPLCFHCRFCLFGDASLSLGKTGSYCISRRKATSSGTFLPACPKGLSKRERFGNQTSSNIVLSKELWATNYPVYHTLLARFQCGRMCDFPGCDSKVQIKEEYSCYNPSWHIRGGWKKRK